MEEKIKFQAQLEQQARAENVYDLDALFRQLKPVSSEISENHAEVERYAREMWAA